MEKLNKNPIANGWITQEELKELMVLSPYRALLRIALEYATIFLTIYLSLKLESVIFYILSVVIIGSRQHALFVLIHDSAHGLLCKSKRLNNVVAELVSWTMFASMFGYKRHHVDHHKQAYLNTMKDPDFARKQSKDWQFPMPKKQFFMIVVRDLLGLNAYDFIKDARDSNNVLYKSSKDKALLALRVLFYVFVSITLTYFNLWLVFLLYWFIPFITYLKFVFRFRSIGDHFCVPNSHLYDRSRTIIPNFFERVLLAPCSISIHNEHHTFAKVPYYNLKRLHDILMKNEDYANSIVFCRSYLDVYKKITH